MVPGLLTTAPVSLKVRQKFRPLGVGGRRANELLKKSCLGPRRVAPGKALVSKFLSGRDFTPGEIQVPTDMDLSLMEDLSDAEAMDEEEPPPKYRPSVGVRSSRSRWAVASMAWRWRVVDTVTPSTLPRESHRFDTQASTNL